MNEHDQRKRRLFDCKLREVSHEVNRLVCSWFIPCQSTIFFNTIFFSAEIDDHFFNYTFRWAILRDIISMWSVYVCHFISVTYSQKLDVFTILRRNKQHKKRLNINSLTKMGEVMMEEHEKKNLHFLLLKTQNWTCLIIILDERDDDKNDNCKCALRCSVRLYSCEANLVQTHTHTHIFWCCFEE